MNLAKNVQVNLASESDAIPSRAVIQRKSACGQHKQGGGECEECKKKNGMNLQRQATNQSSTAEAPPIVNEVLLSPGHTLDSATRSFFETRFGRDLSNVRLHTDNKGAESANAVNALAYTVGQNIVFAEGQYSPDSLKGQALLSHELAHTVQQGSISMHATAENGVMISSPNSTAEIQADNAVKAVLSPPNGGRAAVSLSQSGLMLARVNCSQFKHRQCTAGVYNCGHGGSGTCGWGGRNNGCVCMGASQPTATQILTVLAIIGLSIALLATVIAALLDPEPASKLALAGLTLVETVTLLLMLGYSREKVSDMGLDPDIV